MIKCVLARVNEKKSASEIVKSLNVLQTIQWVQESWKDVTNATIKNCFEKFGIVKRHEELTEVEDEDDLEFAALVREFTPDISASEYVNFDADLQASEPMINNQEIGWRERAREDAINAVQNPTHPSIEISDGEDENEGCEGNIDEENEKKENITCSELIAMLDKMQRCALIDNDSQAMLSTITKKIEDIQIANRKQTTITNFFLSK